MPPQTQRPPGVSPKPSAPSSTPASVSPPEARPRLGPRPLALHLSQAAQLTLSSPAAWMNWNAVSPRLKAQALEAAETAKKPLDPGREESPPPLDPKRGPSAELNRAIGAQAAATLERFVSGVLAYRNHPYRRSLAEPPTVWAHDEGSARLLDYGGAGPAVLLIPSLVNRSTILDLSERASFARWFAQRNRRVLLLDWGWPADSDLRLDLGGYVTERLEPALLETVRMNGGAPVSVIGYCMGGTLAVPLVQRHAACIDKLVLLAPPWDFHAVEKDRALAAATAFRMARPVYDALGIFPLDAIETLFATLDPGLVLRKFLRFASLDPASRAAEDFVALEDWVGDGVPLGVPAAEDALVGWYGENRPALGTWRIGGVTVDPGRVSNPTLVVVPLRDRIVPPESAQALAERLAHAHMQQAPTGHVSLMVGAAAPETVWKPLISFLDS